MQLLLLHKGFAAPLLLLHPVFSYVPTVLAVLHYLMRHVGLLPASSVPTSPDKPCLHATFPRPSRSSYLSLLPARSSCRPVLPLPNAAILPAAVDMRGDDEANDRRGRRASVQGGVLRG